MECASLRPAAGQFLEAFLHLQQWKGEYKRLTYGQPGMPRLQGRTIFKLGRFGVGVYDGTYHDVNGADMDALVAKARAAKERTLLR